MAMTALNRTGSSSSYLQNPGATRRESRAYSSEIVADQGWFLPRTGYPTAAPTVEPQASCSDLALGVKTKSEIPFFFFFSFNYKGHRHNFDVGLDQCTHGLSQGKPGINFPEKFRGLGHCSAFCSISPPQENSFAARTLASDNFKSSNLAASTAKLIQSGYQLRMGTAAVLPAQGSEKKGLS